MPNPFMPDDELHIRLPEADERLLFLDFDGVMHPDKSGKISTKWLEMEPYIGHELFMKDKVALILKLCHELNARIVISSSWRIQGWGFKPFNKIFKNFVIGRTPELILKIGQQGNRQKEIETYLKENDLKNEYAIVDDKRINFLPDNEKVFFTDPESGITDSDARKIMAFFGCRQTQETFTPLNENPKTIQTKLTKQVMYTWLKEITAAIDYDDVLRPKKTSKAPGNVINLPKDKISYVIGDLHGQHDNLKKIVQNEEIQRNIKEKKAILVFLGDIIHCKAPYQDEQASLKTLFKIISLMRKYPSQVFLLRGNHDTTRDDIVKAGEMISFKFNEKVKKKYGQTFFNQLNQFFNRLPLIALGNNFISCHAGPVQEIATENEIINFSALSKEYQQIISSRDFSLVQLDFFKQALGYSEQAFLFVGHHKTPKDKTYVKDFQGIPNTITLQCCMQELWILKMQRDGLPILMKL
jgi:hypothetical protein